MISYLQNQIKQYSYRRKFNGEYKDFQQKQHNSKKGYSAFRKLFVLTKGKHNDDLSDEINKRVGKYQNLNASGVLGNLDANQLNKAVAQMQQDGFYIFDKQLDAGTVAAIYKYASGTPVSYLDVATETQNYNTDKVIFDAKHPISPRYQFNANEIFACPELQTLIFDQSLLAFAQEYLGCKPILDLVAFWWSAPFGGKGKNASAQMYHFDLDRIKFIKFFFYLTDVETETGPHCYVKGSHGALPSAVKRDGRFEDEEIAAIYGKENLLELNGKKGTIMAVDTRGFHKGKSLERDERLLFQIQFTNSLFGQSYPKVDTDIFDKKYHDIYEDKIYSYNNIS